MKTESITPKELKKIMKLSITIDVKLGFYIAYSQRTITIDQSNNWDPNKTRLYKFSSNDAESILLLVNAYAKIFMKRINVC